MTGSNCPTTWRSGGGRRESRDWKLCIAEGKECLELEVEEDEEGEVVVVLVGVVVVDGTHDDRMTNNSCFMVKRVTLNSQRSQG
jgi:hypothetical protein